MRWIAVVSNGACGLSNLLLGSGHLAGVIRRALEGKGFGGAPEFHYGFPFYAVVLLGVVLAGPGLGCLWQTRGLWQGENAARKSALRWSLLLLVLNAPLIPLQDFAVLLSIISGVNVIVLSLVRNRS
jgi:hypothetical protein